MEPYEFTGHVTRKIAAAGTMKELMEIARDLQSAVIGVDYSEKQRDAVRKAWAARREELTK